MTIGTPVECYEHEFTTLTAATSAVTLVTGMAVGTTAIMLVGSTAAKIVSSIVDSGGNTWHVDTTKAGAAEAVSICSAPITTALVGGVDTVTTTWSGTTSSTTDVSIQNVSGLTPTQLDVVVNANGAATPAASGALAVLKTSNEIIFEVNAFGSTAATPGTGFTGVTTTPIGTQTTIGYQIVKSTAAVNGTFTGGTGAWAAAAAAYTGTANPITTSGAFGMGTPCQAVVVSGDQAVKTASGRLCQVQINPTGAVTPTITIYDSPSAASGNILFGPCKIASGVPVNTQFGFDGVNATTGVYVHADSWTTLTVTAYVK